MVRFEKALYWKQTAEPALLWFSLHWSLQCSTPSTPGLPHTHPTALPPPPLHCVVGAGCLWWQWEGVRGDEGGMDGRAKGRAVEISETPCFHQPAPPSTACPPNTAPPLPPPLRVIWTGFLIEIEDLFSSVPTWSALKCGLPQSMCWCFIFSGI